MSGSRFFLFFGVEGLGGTRPEEPSANSAEISTLVNLPEMPDWLLWIQNFLSLNTRKALTLAIAAWVLVFLPSSLLSVFGAGVVGLREQYHTWLGGVALVSSAWLIAAGIISAGESGQVRLKRWRRRGRMERVLQQLTPVERGYLKEYIDAKTTTQTFDFTDGVVIGLERKGILFAPSEYSREGTYTDFNISKVAYDYLRKHPELLAKAVPLEDDF
jgi:hypothetical protein